jgi:response regulator RpfG family c-di-GMP phosphodiesterase
MPPAAARVLLVDDKPEMLDGLQIMLGSRFPVSVAGSGVEALVRCEREGPFAVVVSDFAMPGMTGIELFSELRQRWPDTVRIMLTGCSDFGLALEALEQGAIFRFLTKPPVPSRVLAAVAEGAERFAQCEAERALTEQLLFAQDTLRTFQDTLTARLDDEVGRMQSLERSAGALANATSFDEILTRTEEAVLGLLGSRARLVEVRAPASGLEIVSRPGVIPGEKRALSILETSGRLAAEGLRQRERTQSARRTTLRALESLARCRDDVTGSHLRRVGEYSVILARALRSESGAQALDERFVEHLAAAAPLHDIGKVAIPDAILQKPDELDEGDWEIVRTHPQVGADILRSLIDAVEDDGFLRTALDVTWTHHERWDGQGYPRGLAGTDIPLAGRIVAVADAYDVVTSERPYKRAGTHAAGVARIREQRGAAFDPLVVDAFLAREQEIEAALGRCLARAEAA